MSLAGGCGCFSRITPLRAHARDVDIQNIIPHPPARMLPTSNDRAIFMDSEQTATGVRHRLAAVLNYRGGMPPL